MRIYIFFTFALLTNAVIAQIGYWPNDTAGEDHSLYALTNITLHTDADTTIAHATLLFKEGEILAAGEISIPDHAVLIDGKNSHVYPSFIDPFAKIGTSQTTKKRTWSSMYEPQDDTSSAYNDAMNADTRAVENYAYNPKVWEDHLNQGFGTALTFQQDGIVRGTAVLVGLGNGKTAHKILKPDAALMLSLDKGKSKQAYPTSLMGAIAMLRQLYLDATWYKNKEDNDYINPALDAFAQYKSLPTIIETEDKWDILRADKIGDEAGVQFTFMGSGNEYQRAPEIKSTRGYVILPLEYPKPMDITDLLDAEKADIAELKHWELAPYNAKYLADENIPFVLTLNKLKNKSDFLKKLRQLKETGLSEAQILAALTEKTAQMLNVENQIGQLKKGFLANFIVTSGDLFDEESIIYENWVQGQPYRINKIPQLDIRGTYEMVLNGTSYGLKVKGKIIKPSAEITAGKDKRKVKLMISDHKLAMEIKLPQDSTQNYRVLYPIMNYKAWEGYAINQNREKVPFSITHLANFEPEGKEKKESTTDDMGKIWYPFNAFGYEVLPKQKDYLIKNATVWTNTSQGILQNWDVFISKGQISRLGQNLSSSSAEVIDGTGMHLTSGIIDEHTHIGISRGVNEVGSNNTAEVRIGDVINPDDINFYRQLAGGVTVAQQLHGSANPIGGQSSIVKFRWGQDADGMKYEDAPKFIKFALGENVKQSNWGRSANRFPKSRPGVEQTMDFWFTRALEYEQEKKSNPNYRRDLRLEASLEVVKNERFITCHSYVQSEINMFMNMADKFGFTVNTFTHILEGYKVADKMKEHGANASTFSDWWAYKEEVREAIPYNASILNEVGITTAINSDDAEMARRLNQEAGKMVKYGNTPPEEAWKMVTLNPAKILHIEDKVGSIEKGKDADLVLWTDNPLSVYAKTNKTFVDGILYYDADQQAQKDRIVAEEKNRIIQKMLFSEDTKKGNTQSIKKKEEVLYHCDTITATNQAH
ncbi:amidohydrolase family protein [Flavobacteriaceae bacterium Ap0902]|nr:amidohydrolase family protein [Flavobacteriaceae bacterium Ap0902]